MRRAFRNAVVVVAARLRFLLPVGVLLGTLAIWPALRYAIERLTTSAPTGGTVSGDTEYWCPMCPGVRSDWPNKCPVCNMALVRRQKGEMTPLPDGVVAQRFVEQNQNVQAKQPIVRFQAAADETSSVKIDQHRCTRGAVAANCHPIAQREILNPPDLQFLAAELPRRLHHPDACLRKRHPRPRGQRFLNFEKCGNLRIEWHRRKR